MESEDRIQMETLGRMRGRRRRGKSPVKRETEYAPKGAVHFFAHGRAFYATVLDLQSGNGAETRNGARGQGGVRGSGWAGGKVGRGETAPPFLPRMKHRANTDDGKSYANGANYHEAEGRPPKGALGEHAPPLTADELRWTQSRSSTSHRRPRSGPPHLSRTRTRTRLHWIVSARHARTMGRINEGAANNRR